MIRIKQHHKSKDFWQTVLAVVSKTQYFTKSHVKFLEWYCYDPIAKAGRYELESSSAPSKPHVSESAEADLLDNFDTLRALVGTLGFPLFDPILKSEPARRLKCKGKEAEASGEYSEEGLIVFAGSTAMATESKSAEAWVKNLRADLIASGTLVPAGAVLRFTKDHIFPAPSSAAVVVLGRQANGWTEWRYPDGRTLDEVVRQ